MSDKDNRTNSADFEAHGPTGASRPFGSSDPSSAPEASEAPRATEADDASIATEALPSAEATPVEAGADCTDSAETAGSSAAAAGEKKKAKRRWPTRALAAAGVAGIVIGGATMAGVNALTDDPSHGNSRWNSGTGKAGNGRPPSRRRATCPSRRAAAEALSRRRTGREAISTARATRDPAARNLRNGGRAPPRTSKTNSRKGQKASRIRASLREPTGRARAGQTARRDKRRQADKTDGDKPTSRISGRQAGF